MQSFPQSHLPTQHLLQSSETDAEAATTDTIEDEMEDGEDNSDVFILLSPSPVPPVVCPSERRDIFNFRGLGSPSRLGSQGSPVKSDPSGPDLNMQRQRLTPEPDTAPGHRQKKSLISPRRLSVSLVETFNQLDIPFKSKRKFSAPVCSSLDSESINHLKQHYSHKIEVGHILY